jgi:peptidoglycan/xylan/chitin deacetylase (PgdA/CDA1 family)
MHSNRVLKRIPTYKKIVALTLDVANGFKVLLRMLSVLKRIGVRKATFFITGTWADLNPKIARRIRQSGFEIASHGYRHQDYRKHANSWIEREVKAARKSIHRTTGVWTNLIRTPGGEMNERVVNKLKTMNQTLIHWDVDSLDWKLTDIGEIVKRVVPKTRSGSIILMHACDPWTQSLTAVPRIVRGLRQKGYRFVTVTELLHEQNQRRRLNR